MTKIWVRFVLCGLLPLAEFAAADASLRDAWVRALPPAQPNTAAYLGIANSGATELVVTGASADLAARVEIHTTREVDGMLRMEQLRELRIAPGQRVDLAPGGTHLMLLGLQRMPAAGEDLRLCLQFASGDEACTVAAARRVAPEEGDVTHHHH